MFRGVYILFNMKNERGHLQGIVSENIDLKCDLIHNSRFAKIEKF